jgi:hypothetical protein
MKQLTFTLLAWLVFVVACKKTDSNRVSEALTTPERSCATYEMMEEQMAADPGLRDRLNQLESFTRRMIERGEVARQEATRTIEIPVVVHVLYSNATENISDAQIQSQIDVLNEDYNLKNADSKQVPTQFSKLKADVGVRFELAQVIRKYSSRETWAVNNNMKFSTGGGSDAVDPSHNLNIWVCDLKGILGFSYYPGVPAPYDGVVVSTWAFGKIGRLYTAYNKGRTATHEVGHWMNLHHIWGDATCGNDLVDDTPLHNAANFGCPEYPHYSTCVGTPVEMTMNYMDYTDDACMFMFSKGQKDRMLAIFAPGGPRTSFAN